MYDSIMLLKLAICVLFGISIWSAITRKILHRTLYEKISDYLGQVVLSVVSAFLLKKYININDDIDLFVAGFIAGLFSYGLLLLYRWLTSPVFIEIIKNKIKNKFK